MELKRKVGTTLATGVMLLAFASPALAATAYVGGGTWNYGTGAGRVWSDYLHNTKCHGSSVQGQYYASSGNVSPRYWARASAPDRRWVADHSYYRSYC